MTLQKLFRDRAARWNDKTCVKVKREGKYLDLTWKSFYEEVSGTAAGLMSAGLSPGDRAAILSHTRYEWSMCDAAILSAGGIVVPLYPSLTRPEVVSLLKRSQSRYLFTSDAELAALVAELIDEVDFVEKVIVFDETALEGITNKKFVSLKSFSSGKVDRAKLDARIDAAKEEDIFTIIFTSGTTGEPKGVMLTHRNMISNVEAALSLFDIGLGDVHLSHLPLAHVLERLGCYVMFYSGATVAYAEHISKVADNMTEVAPTISVSVPRIFEKIYAGIQAKALEAPFVTRQLAFWAIKVAQKVGAKKDSDQKIPAHLGWQFSLADKLIYSKIRQKFGGRIRIFVSGGAPLAPELALFFNAIGIPVYEGYGLTETSPIISANIPGNQRAGSVGNVVPGVQCRIAPDGEITVKGPNVFKGYYQDEAATKAAFDEEGWFLTGDIGRFDQYGCLRITDRKKDLIVTAGGKNVAPQKIENILKLDKFIEEVMLYGESKKFMTALVVPDFAWLEKYAAYKGIVWTSRADLVADPKIIDLITRRIEKAQAAAHLASYESVKKFVLLDHTFSQHEGEVTPTLKIRRKNITAHYKPLLEKLYEEG
jgi:long-chain acyl-CoA synthetase